MDDWCIDGWIDIIDQRDIWMYERIDGQMHD